MSEPTVPVGWRVLTLGDIGKWGSGGTPKATNRPFYGGDIPWAVIGDLNDGIVVRTGSTITQIGLDQSSAKLVQPGTILIAMYGSIGKLGIAGTEMATNQAIAFVVRDPNIITREYLFNYLRYQREAFLSSGKGMTQQNISQTVLKAWPIAVAPLEEQERIVEILEEQLSRLDAVVKSVQTVRESISRFRRSVLASCFGQSELSVGGPGHTYQSAVLGEHVEVVMGQAPPGSECNVAGIGTPFVKAGEFSVDGPIVREWTTRPLRMARQGDVLLCVVGATCGKVNRSIDCAIGRSVAALRPGESLDSEYLYYFMLHKTEEFRKSSQGSAQSVITRGGIREQRIPLPGILRQQEIARYLQAQFEQMQSATRALERAERKSVSLRRSLLHSAFTGELTRSWRDAHV